MNKRIYTVNFLGITLVKLDNRPRKITLLVQDEYTAALLPNGKVAIACSNLFEEGKFERNSYLQISIARLLEKLGKVSKKQVEDFVATISNNKDREMYRREAEYFEQAALMLGIKITNEQMKHIQKLIKI